MITGKSFPSSFDCVQPEVSSFIHLKYTLIQSQKLQNATLQNDRNMQNAPSIMKQNFA